MPTDIIKKVQIKNAQSGLNDNYNVGAEAGDVEVDQTGNHITEDNVQDALSDIYNKFYNIDTTPTLNSDELVTSGGVALAIKNAQSVKVGSSSTAAATAAKVATTLAGDFELRNGADLIITFSYDNTASGITLNVDNTGAKPIYYKGAAIEASVIKTNIPYEFVYDGTNFVLVGSAGGLTGVELTEAEYDDLPLTDRTNPDKLFFIDDGLEENYSATMIAYDNGETGLQAVNVQDAIDEILEGGVGGGGARYGISETAAATAIKIVTTEKEDFELNEGASVIVKFTYTDTAGSVQLNVDSTGAISVYYNGAAIEAGVLTAGNAFEFVYDGTNFTMVGSAGGSKTIELTQAQYDALTPAQKNDGNKVYFIIDAPGVNEPYSATNTSYDNTTSGLAAVNVQGAIDELAQGGGGGGGTAASVSYNNTTSGLQATNVQGAIDELVDSVVDVVEENNTNPVTSNAVYEYVDTMITQALSSSY